MVDSLRTTAESITVDGDLSDWGAIPFYFDAVGDSAGDASRDLTSIAIAPLDQEILFAVETAGTPATGSSFSLVVDLQGDLYPEVIVGLDSTSSFHTLLAIDRENQVLAAGAVTGLELVHGAGTIEVRLPYASITPLLPPAYAAAIASANHRSWVRAAVHGAVTLGATIDFTPSAGSYRLITTPYPLDPALPTSGIDNPLVSPLEMTLPMDGPWLVAQGADGATTHAGFWMYDFVRMDETFRPSNPEMSSDNEDYYAFGSPVFAPLAGTVTSVVENQPDNVPGIRGPINNEVLIDGGDGWLTRLFHFMQNGVTVTTNQAIAEGDPIGLVGNSGNSGQAHMHLDTVGGGGTRRIALRSVDVMLNPGPNTPWRRRVASWEPRVGFFVEVPEPDMGSALFVASGLLSALVRRRLLEPEP